LDVKDTSRLLFIGALLFIGISWSATIPLSKVAVSSGHAPLGITFWQQVIVALVLGIFLTARRAIFHQRINAPLDRASLVYYTMIAALGTVIPNLFSYWAISQLPAGIMAIIVASVPMFALAIAIGMRIEPFVAHRAFGVCIGGVAVVLLMSPNTSLPEPEKAVFVLVGLVAPFCYGMEGNYIARFAPSAVDPVVTLFCASIIGAIVTLPLSIVSGTWIDMPSAFAAPEQAIVTLSIFHAVAYTGYVWLVGKAGPVFSSQVAYVVTLSAVMLSAVFLGENYSPYAFASLALMLVGIMFVQPPLKAKS
jgi:drug/metabolite transporter (DMT)-like permease